MTQTSGYYQATAHPAPRRPALRGALACDVCVIGAGYTGLLAALELAERGFRVAVVEAHRVGWGASGRNGGQIVTGYSTDMSRVRRLTGVDDARLLWRMAEEAKTIVADRIARHAIDCDLRWGYLFAAAKPRHLAGLAEMAEDWARDYGYGRATPLDRAGLAAELGGGAYFGGLKDEGGGHLHPLNYALGLARAAEAAGVTLFEDSAALSVDADAATLRTAEGEVRANHLILCGNAHVGRLVPEAARRILPVATQMIATAPLGAERARRLIPSGAAVSDTNHIVDYFRLSADGRLLFGGGASYWSDGAGDPARAIGKRMRRVFPELADVAIEHAWTGHVAITANRMPWFGRVGRRLWFAHGYSGHGVLLTAIAGRLLAEAVAGTEERFDVYARIPHAPFPGGRARAPLLALAMAWYRLLDLL
ncbi:MAG: FAD-binding oxidoreductase [Alphaproteobacteria bacterium]|nr:FAD-binding oxidoreductase [Alphaproteobacteria bacterium]